MCRLFSFTVDHESSLDLFDSPGARNACWQYFARSHLAMGNEQSTGSYQGPTPPSDPEQAKLAGFGYCGTNDIWNNYKVLFHSFNF